MLFLNLLKELRYNFRSMVWRYFYPHPALSEYVESICIMEHEFTASDIFSPIYTYMPTHTRFLCFYLADPLIVKRGPGKFEKRGNAMIVGPQLTPVTLNLGKMQTNVIIMFRPCGLYRLLGFSLEEIVDCDFEAKLVLGNDIDNVTERLTLVASDEQRNAIVQEYLLGRLSKLRPAFPLDRAMLTLIAAHGNLSMDNLASQACLSVRQLERQSLQRIGFSPKYFSRMVRFSEAYKFKERNPLTPWINIAYRFGYFDQMHLIRDFRHFTENNPSILTEELLSHSVKFNSFML